MTFKQIHPISTTDGVEWSRPFVRSFPSPRARGGTSGSGGPRGIPAAENNRPSPLLSSLLHGPWQPGAFVPLWSLVSPHHTRHFASLASLPLGCFLLFVLTTLTLICTLTRIIICVVVVYRLFLPQRLVLLLWLGGYHLEVTEGKGNIPL